MFPLPEGLRIFFTPFFSEFPPDFCPRMLSAAEAESLYVAARMFAAEAAAMRCLSRAEHSRFQLETKLRRKGFLPQEIRPALDFLEEKRLLCSTEVYRQICRQWGQMDTALVNIGDYPSSPDFASLVRYGSLLQHHHACGRMLAYYFNEAGMVIQSDQDFAIQIPMEALKQCPRIIGVCSANTSARALRGALNTGILTHIVARADLVQELLGE